MIDLIMLSTLLGGPKHGYQLKHEAGLIMGQSALHNNLVYPLLRRFTIEGWVTKKTVPGQRGQTRQQYAITALGRRTLVRRLSEYSEHDSHSLEGFLTRVGMFEMLEPKIREHILQQRESYVRKQEQKLATLQQGMELGKYGGEVVRYLCNQSQSELSWIQHLRRFK